MSYVPRKKTFHISWKITIAVIVFCMTIALATYLLLPQPTKDAPLLSVCGWNENKTKEKLVKSYTDIYTISDYFYYGESLDLFSEDYSVDAKNDLARKNIQLYNVCNDESVNYTLESTMDRQIDVGELPPGFYEVFVSDNQVKKRIVFDEEIEKHVFTSVARNGKVKEIEVLANPSMISSDTQLDNTYVFISVKEAEVSSERIDVFIDPYGNTLNSNGVVERNNEGNGLSENNEMYEAANILKSKLEAYGLRVEVSKKDKDEVVSYYGEDGRMERAYKKHARYYLELGMNISQISEYRGIEIYHSSYASEALATSLVYAIKKNTQIPVSNAYTWSDRNAGVGMASRIIGEDNLVIYDDFPILRESGGRATFAASINSLAATNEEFAKENIEGMMALSINPIYISNSEDVAYWVEHKELILDELAKAFVSSIHIGNE